MFRTLVSLSLVGCIENGVSPTGDPAAGPGPDVLVTPPALEFGTLGLGQEERQVFRVQNVGESTLHVSDVAIGAGLSFAVPGEGFDLEPGEEREVEVTFTPMGADENYGQVLVVSDDPDSPEATVDLLGRGAVPELVITPESYNFGDTFVPCGASVDLELKNVGNEVLVIDELGYASGGMLTLAPDSLPTLPLTLAPGGSTTVRVDLAAASAGSDTGRLDVESNDPRGVVSADQNGEGTYEESHVESFTEPGIPPVDVLLLVDNSGSMEGDNQDDVTDGMPDFFDELQSVADWQLMLVTQDSGCATGGVLDASSTDPEGFVSDHAFDGGGDLTEKLLSLADRALGLTGPGACNEGFLRPGALLHVIVMSDESEQSGRSGPYWVSQLGSRVSTPAHLKISGVLDLNRNCGDNSGPGGYEEAIDATGGAKLDICSPRWGNQLSGIASEVLAGMRTYNLAAEPDPQSVVVEVEGVATTSFTIQGSDVTITDPPIGEGDEVVITYGVAADCP